VQTGLSIVACRKECPQLPASESDILLIEFSFSLILCLAFAGNVSSLLAIHDWPC